MAYKFFVIWLNEHRFIAVTFTTVQGEVISFVVLLMTRSADGDRIISRFDTAHGIAHQDVLTSHGNLSKKHWLSEMTFDQALAHAINHFKAHHQNYPG